MLHMQDDISHREEDSVHCNTIRKELFTLRDEMCELTAGEAHIQMQPNY